MLIRRATPGELPFLSGLCFRSKAMWGYDNDFLEACRAELALTLLDFHSSFIVVAEEGDVLLGMAQVSIEKDQAQLQRLFVEPGVIGFGVGTALFEWALELSREQGAARLMIESDPEAAPFYRHMGARDAGLVPSGSIPGRLLPRLSVTL